MTASCTHTRAGGHWAVLVVTNVCEMNRFARPVVLGAAPPNFAFQYT